ncbi:MAG: hypothetical protein TEF_00455 [Rhizobiales bacterium NRL2]|jgi:putative protein-disulfide isomerase|nr:MAG: hypothetical protein TEF_00455 [Rhizobiales bacterium NRL2]
MGQLRFIYFADPMCSWCWGFSPNLEKIRAAWPDIPVRLGMGGLYPGVTKPMSTRVKAEVANHWHHVEEATGQPFDHRFFEREGFVYDTLPSSQALVAVKQITGENGLDFLARLHGAFYRDNRDLTDAEVLADIAGEHGVDRAAFREMFESDRARQLTERDIGFARQLGVQGFPALLGYDEERYRLISMGWQSWDWLRQVIDRWISKSATVN